MKIGYTILNTESTRDFAESLIGMSFQTTGFTKIVNGIKYIELNTCDGELLFAEDEIQIVK